MRFKLFGFKGELSTSGGQKKKGKANDEDVIVGGTFRVHSEFGPSSSRFKTKPMNGAAKPDNGARNGNIKPKDWCGTPIPKQNGPPPPPGGYSAEVTPEHNEVKPTAPKALKSNLKKTAPTPPEIKEPKINKNETNSVHEVLEQTESEEIKTKTISEPTPIIETSSKQSETSTKLKTDSESEDEFGAKISKSTPNTNNQNDLKVINTNENEKKFITLSGFDNDDGNESIEDSEDEYGAKKSSKKTEDNTYYGTKSPTFETVQTSPVKQPQAQALPKTTNNFGYSDQAASIFFRSDSPEPEQRVRNFTIRKENDDDDNLSQTSA